MIKVTIRAEDHLSGKITKFLRELEKEGLTYEIQPNSFEANQAELEANLTKLQSGESKTYTIGEADSFLEEAITKYKSRTSG